MNINIKINKRFQNFIKIKDLKDYVNFGGYGSSKSYHTALKLVLKSLQEKRRTLVVRAVAKTLYESCYSLIKEIIFTNNLEHLFTFTKSPMKIQCLNGSEFLFMGLDDPAKLKSINAIDTVWIEESAEISYDAFKELKGRLRGLKTLFLFLTFNPVSKNSWIYKHYFKNRGINEEVLYKEKEMIVGDTYYLHSTVLDNKFINQDYIDTLKELEKYDPELYRIAYLGHFGYVGERVFNNYEIIEHSKVIERVEKLSEYGMGNLFDGLDLGFSVSYNALVRCAIDREANHLFIYDEAYNKGLINSEVIEMVKSKLKHKYKTLIVDSSRPEIIEEMARNGIRAYPSKKGANSVIEGLQKIKSFKKVYISDKCRQITEDFTEFSHKKDKNGEFTENEFNIDSHTIDAIRYAIEEYRSQRLKGGMINDNTREN